MKGKDSYPPASSKNSSVNTMSKSAQNNSEISPESNSDTEEVRKRIDVDRLESGAFVKKDDTAIDKDSFLEDSENVDAENFGNSEENSESPEEEWDGSEAEIVVDDESEEYEEENTGIKIKYTLKPEEIREFVQSSEGYEKNKKAQKKHTIIQSIVFVLMVILSIITGNRYYLILSAFPIVSLGLIWIVPYIGVRNLIGKVLRNQEFSVEVFPDKIDVTTKNSKKEIMLDGSCESEEFENMIQIFSDGELALIIPTRAVEPEFLADLQAMVLAGTRPRYKD